MSYLAIARKSLDDLKRDADSVGRESPDLRALSTEEIESAIHRGQTVRLWSKTLNDWVYWVFGEDEKRRLQSRKSEAVIYTLNELTNLIRAETSPENLNTLHLAKKVLGGTVQLDATPRVIPKKPILKGVSHR